MAHISFSKSRAEKSDIFFNGPVKNIVEIITALCLLIHSGYGVFFWFAHIPHLAIMNAISVGLYIFIFYLTTKGFFKTPAIIAFFEVLTTVVVTSVTVGWNYGFFLYAICLVPLVFFCNLKSKLIAFTSCSIDFLVFIVTFVICNRREAFYSSNHLLMEVMFVINAVICFSLLALLSYVYSKTSASTNRHLYEKNKNLQILASTDPLTGLFNRRTMFLKINEEKAKATDGVEFSLVLIDVDNFKRINDEHGHQTGDKVLKKVCEIIRNTLRKDDIICRWGGEEILILLPATNILAGETVAEKLRREIEGTHDFSDEKEVLITVTAGVCSSKDEDNISELINLVDKCLYRGKSQGKNCVVSSKSLYV